MANFDTITGPDWAAPYLVNGDASGITDDERAKVDAWLAREQVASIVDIARDDDGNGMEPRFTWSYSLYFPEAGCRGGSVIDYVCTFKSEG